MPKINTLFDPLGTSKVISTINYSNDYFLKIVLLRYNIYHKTYSFKLYNPKILSRYTELHNHYHLII